MTYNSRCIVAILKEVVKSNVLNLQSCYFVQLNPSFRRTFERAVVLLNRVAVNINRDQ
jgi:hypothetical protein